MAKWEDTNTRHFLTCKIVNDNSTNYQYFVQGWIQNFEKEAVLWYGASQLSFKFTKMSIFQRFLTTIKA
jgi:hypothetical protein